MKGISKMITILVVLGIVGSAITYSYITGGKIPLTTFGGFVTLSLGQVDFQSNDPTIGGKSWVLTVSQNGQGQFASGTFSKDSIKDSVTGERATKDLTITMSMDEQTCEYPFKNPVKAFYKKSYDRKVINKIFWSQQYITDCRNAGGTAIYKSSFLDVIFYCVKDTFEGYYATIGDRTLKFKSTITLKAGTQTITGTINNKETTSVDFGVYGKGYWAGNLVTGEDCPIPSSSAVSGAFTSENWRIIDTNSYNTYKNYHDSGFENCAQNWISYDSGSVEECINIHNSYMTNALSSKLFTSSGGSQAVSSGNLYDGKTIINLNKMIQYPVITLHIKADFLGVTVPVGKPKIISVTSKEFKTGTDGFITVQVQNIGDAHGSFGVSVVDCGQGITQTGITQYLGLDKNEIGTVYIPISGTTQTELTTTCTVKAFDRNNPSNFDTATVSVTVKALVICNEGERRCNGRNIEQCISNQWKTVETCEQECLDPIDKDPYCETPKKCSEHGDPITCRLSGCEWCSFEDKSYCADVCTPPVKCSDYKDETTCLNAGCNWCEGYYCAKECPEEGVGVTPGPEVFVLGLVVISSILLGISGTIRTIRNFKKKRRFP